MNQEKLTHGDDLMNQLITKSWEDLEFKKRLISNPMETIGNILGKKLDVPNGKEIIVIDQSDENKFYINIPIKPNLEDLELSENELELVAGGGCSVRNAGVEAGEWAREKWNDLVDWWNS